MRLKYKDGTVEDSLVWIDKGVMDQVWVDIHRHLDDILLTSLGTRMRIRAVSWVGIGCCE